MKKFIFDLFPVLCFFLVYRYAGNHPEWAQGVAQQFLGAITRGGISASQAPILLATVVTIIATALQVLWLMVTRQKVEVMLWITLAIIVVFGGATIWFNDEHFIKWKPTILYLVFAIGLAAGHLLWQKNGLQKLLGQHLQLPPASWGHLLWAWVSFFSALAALNLWIAYQWSTDAWVNFKLFGATGLLFLFIVAQSIYFARYIKK